MSGIARPFGMLLMFLYGLVNNYGVALIIFAIAIKVILLPFQMKSKKGMLKQGRLQPKMAELQKKHGTNKQKINEEMAKLYKSEGVNPASGCLWGFLPLPIMFALFLVIREPLTMMLGIDPALIAEGGAIDLVLQRLNFSIPGTEVYHSNFYFQVHGAQFITNNWHSFASFAGDGLKSIDFSFLGLNLAAIPQWNFLWAPDLPANASWLSGFVLFLLPLLSAGSQFLATGINRKITPQGSPEASGGQMKIFMMLMPLISVYFGFVVPGAFSIYWTTGTLLQILQDVLLTKHYTKILDKEDAVRNKERAEKEAEIEAKREEAERKKAEGVAQERNQNTSKRKKQKSEKQEQQEKAAEWEKKHAPDPVEEKHEPSRVENRRFARGRAYDPDRFEGVDDADGESDDEESIADGSEPDSESIEDSEAMESGQDDEDEELNDDEVETEAIDSESDNDEEDETEAIDSEPDSDDEDESPPERFETKRFDDGGPDA